MHKAGFVTIVGQPNVGKSTFINKVIKKKLSITSKKAHTTRKSILSIFNTKDFQIIFTDTPGKINKVSYNLHKSMLDATYSSIDASDVILFMTDIHTDFDYDLFNKCLTHNKNIIIIINKSDLDEKDKILEYINDLEIDKKNLLVLPISSKSGENINLLIDHIKLLIPTHPPYFPKDIYSDKPEKFFVSEIIREKIFMFLSQEIPYSCHVKIDKFDERQNLIVIKSIIYVERESQKKIIIGMKGSNLKKIGINARKEIEKFLGKKIHLETFVKVLPNWKKNKSILKNMGY